MNLRIALLMGTMILLGSCSGKRQATAADESLASGTVATAVESPSIGGTTALPHQLIYRISGDYANNVPVTLSPDKKRIVSYPAPSDITPQSTPVVLSDGWLLDRRGVGFNSVFTRWTYEEYAALDHTPSLEEIQANIIPGAEVTEIATLPSTVSSPMSPEEIDTLIADGLKDCKIQTSAPRVKRSR